MLELLITMSLWGFSSAYWLFLSFITGSSAPSSGTHKYKRGSHLQSRPPLRRKRSLRNGRPRQLPYGNTLNNQSNINGIGIAENLGRNGLSNAAHHSTRSTELGSVADESLTSCTGPMSQDESDFSSFNLNSASIGASTKILKKDGYGLSFYLCRIE